MFVKAFMFLNRDETDSNRYWEVHVDRLSGDYSLAFHFTAVAYFDDPIKDFEGGSLVFKNVSRCYATIVLARHPKN